MLENAMPGQRQQRECYVNRSWVNIESTLSWCAVWQLCLPRGEREAVQISRGKK